MTELRCSFCDKGQRYVRKLVAGPDVQICDECIEICVDIISQARAGSPEAPEVPQPTEPTGDVPPAPHLLATACTLCNVAAPVDHMIVVETRGPLCPGCIGAIEAAIAAAREQ